MRGELGHEEAADIYERELRAELPQEMPQLDFVLLGIGPDAHCASLFPNQPSLEERSRAVVGVEQAGFTPFVPRVTLTLPAINAARLLRATPCNGSGGIKVIVRALPPQACS